MAHTVELDTTTTILWMAVTKWEHQHMYAVIRDSSVLGTHYKTISEVIIPRREDTCEAYYSWILDLSPAELNLPRFAGREQMREEVRTFAARLTMWPPIIVQGREPWIFSERTEYMTYCYTDTDVQVFTTEYMDTHSAECEFDTLPTDDEWAFQFETSKH